MRPLSPDQYFSSITEINPARLTSSGITSLLIDLEGTLVPRDTWNVSTGVYNWIKEAKRAGIKICLLSNTLRAKKIIELASRFEVPVISLAFKPLPFSFMRAMKILGSGTADSAVIGDQLFMDILGGKMTGIRTIMVEPLTKETNLARRFMRWVEGIFLKAERSKPS